MQCIQQNENKVKLLLLCHQTVYIHICIDILASDKLFEIIISQLHSRRKMTTFVSERVKQANGLANPLSLLPDDYQTLAPPAATTTSEAIK